MHQLSLFEYVVACVEWCFTESDWEKYMNYETNYNFFDSSGSLWQPREKTREY